MSIGLCLCREMNYWAGCRISAPGQSGKILSALFPHRYEVVVRDKLAELSGYSPEGGAFGNPLGALRTKGLIDYPRPGQVQLAQWLAEEL